MAVRTDGFHDRLLLWRHYWAVGWNLCYVDVRRDVMLMEFLAGLAVLMFIATVVYTFWMVSEEQKDIGE